MPKTQNNGLLSWLVLRPIMFALIAFITMTVATAISGTIGISGTFANVLGIIAFLGSAAWLVRKLPADNLDRRVFISVNTAQTIVISIAFIVSTIIIFSNAQQIMMRLLFMQTHSTASFIALVCILALFYLYLCGIFIGNLYAKYRRIRAMGVGMWKTLATAPFGFCMLWIPGYLMEETSNKNSTEHQGGVYNRLINWIIARPSHSAMALVLLIIMSGFIFGFNTILLNLGMGAIFAIWCIITGMDKMRKDMGGAYSTTAIIINVVMIICTIGYFAIVRPAHNTNTPAQETIEYIDTVQQQ